MLQVSPFTRILVALIVLGGILVALPNALPDRVTSRFPSWLPHNSVSLGLDLQGGSYLLLEVDFAQVQRDKDQATIGDIRAGLRKAHIQYLDLGANGDVVQVRVTDPAAQAQARSVLDGINPALNSGSVLSVGGAKEYDIAQQGGLFTMTMT
jgi:preprotein translocase subunit SecD